MLLFSAPGPGVGNVGGCSGGGHSGNGGRGQAETIAGMAYAAFLNPTTFGKNGGHSTFPHLGGRGGGRFYLNVSHTLTVDGNLLARGGQWRSVEAGGGSGGAILMNVYTIDGAGVIDASGGAGYGGSYGSHGGGGGGGPIALYYHYNFFVGMFNFQGFCTIFSLGPGTKTEKHLIPVIII